MNEESCGHCGRPITTAARGWAADGTVLCHTGVIPAIAPHKMDCYVLVTRDGHPTTGECCRTPTFEWQDGAIPMLALLPWAASLTMGQRRQMLDEAATSQDPWHVIERWERVAKAAWPLKLNIVSGPPGGQAPGYGAGYLSAAYERGRRQGRHEAGGR